ncbi:hypothetical protein ACFX2I_001868 [Malus domestica]
MAVYPSHVQFPTVPVEPDPTSPMTRVHPKNFPINPKTRTTTRLFLPRGALDLPSFKLPFVFYYHGSIFICLCSTSSIIHNVPICLSSSDPLLSPLSTAEHQPPPLGNI